MSPHLFLCSRFILRLPLTQEFNIISLSNFKELYLEVFFLHCLEYPIQMFLRLIHVEAFIIYESIINIQPGNLEFKPSSYERQMLPQLLLLID